MQIQLNGQSVEISDLVASKYDFSSGNPLEQILKDQFNPYAISFENMERELSDLLGRFPTEEEVNACL